MSTHSASRRLHSLLVLLLSFGLLLTTTLAQAAGRVEWKSREFKEREGGSWRLELAIYLNSAPDVPHVPIKFEFQPTAYYERSMVDGDKLIERTVPLENHQSLIESQDVGFLDSGSGKIEKRTRFTFKVTRAHNYEAGEYKVTIRDGRNGQIIGTPTTLKFQGENEVIDRRAMVFAAKDKKKEEPKEGAAKAAEGDGEKKAASEEGGDKAEGDAAEKEPTETAEGETESASNDDSGPPPVKEKPGGCGCRFDSGAADQSLGIAIVALFALVFARRRRTRR